MNLMDRCIEKASLAKIIDGEITTNTEIRAEKVIKAGYGNVNEAVKEFAEFIIAQMTDKCHRGCPYKQGTFTDVDMHRLMNEFFEKENRNAD